MNLYKKFNPTHILDPCAGWGGRMIGAMALDIDYTGIDLNDGLKTNYEQIKQELGDFSESKTHMIFQDALTADISGIDFDMVFTSPPFFNIEIYRGQTKKTKSEWIEFYKNLFLKYWNALKTGGVFAINVNDEIFQKTLRPLLGEPDEIFNHKISQRGKNTCYKSKEMVYIWMKPNHT